MGAFRYPIRVRYADTDALGVVYNAVYLAWFEIGRTEWLRARGLPYSQVEARGLSLPVTEASIRFRAPARYDDLLEIETELQLVRSRVVAFGYRLVRGECRIGRRTYGARAPRCFERARHPDSRVARDSIGSAARTG